MEVAVKELEVVIKRMHDKMNGVEIKEEIKVTSSNATNCTCLV